MPSPYAALDYSLANFRGVNLAAAPDALKPGEFSLCQNASDSVAGQLSTRPGCVQIGQSIGGGPVHSVFVLSDPVSTYPTTLTLFVVGAGTKLYGWASGMTSWLTLATGFSGNPLTAVVYRLSGTGQPWLIIGDSAKMVKIAYLNGTWATYQLGLTPDPDVATVTVIGQLVLPIELFNLTNSAKFTFAGTSGHGANSANIASGQRASGIVTLVTSAPENFVASLVAEVTGVSPDTSYNGTFVIQGITSSDQFQYNQLGGADSTIGASGEVVAGWSMTASAGATAQLAEPLSIDLTEIEGNPSLATDTVNLWVYVDNIAHLTDFRILFDVDPSSVSGGSLTATAFTKNYYWVSVFSQLSTGWNLVSIAKSAFTRVGQETYDWSGVVALAVWAFAGTGDTPTLMVNDLYMQGASYPDASVGVGYDWRDTFYDSVTKSESNPSPVMAVDAYPIDQAVELLPGSYSSDPQVDTIRCYRRGGTLASNWYLVGSQPNTGIVSIATVGVPGVSMNATGDTATYATLTPHKLSKGDTVYIANVTNPAFNGWFRVSALGGPNQFSCANLVAGAGVTSGGGTVQAGFIDGSSDEEIAAAPILSLQNDVPITTVSPDGTILYGVSLPYIWGPYAGTEIFGDGDPNQPGNIYWSNPTNPDGWGSLNFLEITQSSDPLLLGCYWQGSPWARSRESAFQGFPASIPGFYSFNDVGQGESLGSPWALLGGSGLPFMPIVGKSGIFISTGGVGQSITDDRLWPLFDPKSTRTDAVNWSSPYNRLAFYDHHLRWTYQGNDSTLRQYLYDVDHDRWVGPNSYAFGGTIEFNQPETTEALLIGGYDGNLYSVSAAATTDNGAAIVPLVQTGVYKPDGFENDSEWGSAQIDAVAPVGGISVLASFGTTLAGFTAIGSCVSTSRATQPMSLLDLYSCGMALKFTWSGFGSLFGWNILHRDDGIPITHAETPPASFGAPGYGHAYRALVCLRSTGVVNLTVTVDNGTPMVQPIPSTGNTRMRQELFVPLNKGYLCRVALDALVANQGFRVYPEDSALEWMPWNGINPIETPLPFTGGFTGRAG